jgi:cytoskeletal protein CcmA (bactofilin family)
MVPEPQEQTLMMMPKRDELPSSVGGQGDLLIGRGVRFEGKLTFQGTVRVDAEFVGSISTDGVLVVGEAARIKADVTCGTIIVHGEVNGNVKARSEVELHASARVFGDLETPSIVIEKGVVFHGACKMEELERGARSRSAATPPRAAASGGK